VNLDMVIDGGKFEGLNVATADWSDTWEAIKTTNAREHSTLMRALLQRADQLRLSWRRRKRRGAARRRMAGEFGWR
jgi:hypothetical protein